MDKLDIAYDNFRAKVNSIITNERNSCNNAKINGNNNRYLDSIDNLVVSLKNYRGIPRHYSDSKPDITAAPISMDVTTVNQPEKSVNLPINTPINSASNLLGSRYESTDNTFPSFNPSQPTASAIARVNERKQKIDVLKNTSCEDFPNLNTSDPDVLTICREKCGDNFCFQKYNSNSNQNNTPNATASATNATNACNAIDSTTPVSCQLHCDCYKPGSKPSSGRIADVIGPRQDCVKGEVCKQVKCAIDGDVKKTISQKCIL